MLRKPFLLGALIVVVAACAIAFQSAQSRDRALHKEVSRYALVAGRFEYVIFAPEMPTHVVREVLKQLASHRYPKNGLHLDTRELDINCIETIGNMRQLKKLNLARTNITDHELVYFAKLSKLRTFNLTETKVTDAGLESLKSLPALRELYVAGTGVTEQGLLEFKKARPDVDIEYSLQTIRKYSKRIKILRHHSTVKV